jgi:putative nucleotidyltransferase with HDIG domain
MSTGLQATATRRPPGLLADAGVRRGLWALACWAATAALFASVSLPREVNLHAGQVAPYTIKAPRDLIDRPATAALQEAAAAKVQPVYRVDPAVTAGALGVFDAGIQAITAARQSLAAASAPSASGSAGAARSSAAPPGPSPPDVLHTLQKALGLSLPDSDYAGVLGASASDLAAVTAAARERLQAALNAGVGDDPQQLAAARAALQGAILALPAPAAVDRVVAALAAQALQPNRFEDPVATATARADAASAVPPVVIARGQVIVREGDVVTPADVQRLRDAGLLHPGGSLGLLAGSALLAGLLLALCWAFLAQFQRRALRDERHLVLFGGSIVAALAGTRLGMQISPFLAPVPWAAMMAAVAYGPGEALFVGGVTGLAAGLLVRDLSVAVAAVCGAWTAAFGLRRLGRRTDLVRAGLYAGAVAGSATLLLVGLFVGQDPGMGHAILADLLPPEPALRATAVSASTGLLCGVLAIGTLPFAEALGVLTPFKLLELADPGQPLLRRMMVEAPGTYHHSLMVANLAEAACQAIGADALLVRAGAYYHDIGKLKRPAFFVENQLGGDNPHAGLSPQLSALVITSHVRDGVEMARAAHLPEEIIDFIRTHHGTTLVRYFYAAAASAPEGNGQAPSEADFRYEGPLPATRETAVVMLADGAEAAVRALRQPTPETISAAIQQILADRLRDGQLEEAALTLKEVHLIGATFERILLGAYHARIAYPDALEAEAAPSPQDPAGPARRRPGHAGPAGGETAGR